ncbi:MAG: hypothetical protein AB8G99_23115, partial [Planctomycetaceae bacterium]
RNSKDRYNELIELLRLKQHGSTLAITVGSVTLLYFNHAKDYYRKNGRPTSEVGRIRAALKFLNQMHADTLIEDFGPRALKSIQQLMVETPVVRKNKAGEVVSSRTRARSAINKNVRRIVAMFKWATEQELCSGERYQKLRAVPEAEGGIGTYARAYIGSRAGTS